VEGSFCSYIRIYHVLLSYLLERFIVFCLFNTRDIFHVGLGDDLLVLRNEKQDVYILLLAMTKTKLHLLKMQAKCNVTTINYVMHTLH
jgi:hypothetical protein